MADTPDTNEVRLHGQFTQVDENGDVTVLYPNTTVDDITGILPIEKGGTGSSSEQDFVQNIINKILNNSDLTDISQLYSRFITSVDERPNTLNTFTNSGWYYFNYLHAPVGNVHPAIYNGDISEEHMVSTDPGFLFVINYGTHICQYWIPALKRGSNEGKNSIYERKCENTYWSEWVHLNGDSNASSVYNVTFTNSYIEDATTIFKYNTNTGGFKFKHGNIVIINVEWQGFNNLKIQIDNDDARELDYGNSIIGTDNLSNQLDMTTTLILLCNVNSYKIIGKLDTQYTLDGSYNDDDEWVTTLTPSVGEATSSTVPVMQGATSIESGSSGLVPAPEIEDQDKFLKGDGSWTTIPVMQGATSTESGSSGLVPAPNNPADRQKFLKGDGSWSNVHLQYISVGTGLYRFSTDNEGHVASTHEVNKDDITRLGIPSENTTYDIFNMYRDGLVPRPDSASATKFLNASGTWTEPSGISNGTTYDVFSPNANGLVPRPDSASATKFLNASGTWTEPTGTYTHPSYTDKTSGLYKITVDSTGHVSATTSVTKSDITSLNIPGENTTYDVFSPNANGLVPRPDSASATKFLNASGTWTEPTGTTYSTFTHATANTAGTAGLVPGPPTNTYPDTTSKFLNSAGGWSTPTGTYTHPSSYTDKALGLYKIKVNNHGHVIDTASVTYQDMPLVYGSNNDTHDSTSAFIIGNNNNVYKDVSDTYRTYILGSNNKIKQITSLNNNLISNHGSVVIGFNNTINTENHVFIVGDQNNVDEPTTGNTDAWTFGCGMGLDLPDHRGFYIGKYNRTISETNGSNVYVDTNTAFCIGNGTGSDQSSRDNGFRVTFSGDTYGKSWNASGADYAEFVKPWFDGNVDNEDRVGYMVTIKDGYLHKANEGDYIIGITSGSPSIVGNADENYYWKYERDEFNRIVYELVDETKEETDENGNKLIVKTGNKINVPKVSSNYDPSLANSYVERKYRPEWSYVGMRGIVPVRDDGTCEAGGFCKCGTDGIATKSERGLDTYYVIERINDHIVSVEVK